MGYRQGVTVTFAQIEPTTRCNFTCGFCAGRAMAQRDLDWNVFRAFLAAHPALRHVELQGEGEPLLHPRFFDMLAACRGRGIRVSLITNGSLLSAERVERLLDFGIHSIHVSMESADPTRFAEIRRGKFDKVREGLARLVQRRRERGLVEPAVGLAVTVLRSTQDALQGIVDLYRKLSLDGGIVAQRLQPMPVYSRHYDAAMQAELMDDADVRRFLGNRQALAQLAPVPRPDAFFYHALFDGFDPRRDNCPWLVKGSYLSADGRTTACCFMKDEAGDAPSLLRTLEEGEVPTACAGCGTAAAIANARRDQAMRRAVLK
ncbi:radical SAM protein [Sphingomonas tabacisoli]|uniref:Radical SAM protein n=1 Tax=Sphingomonas tabacisoli TaxID=2249466 RepID=A0ABW4HXI0_9SPHN